MKHDGNVAILIRGFCHIFYYSLMRVVVASESQSRLTIGEFPISTHQPISFVQAMKCAVEYS